MSLFTKKTEMPSTDDRPAWPLRRDAGARRSTSCSARRCSRRSPTGLETAVFGMGCFWGAERKFWETDGVYTTAVGYAGGFTPNPTYEEVCSGRTGHTEVGARRVRPRAHVSYDELLRVFWESHDPTQGMRQGNDVGTQYRSGDLRARRRAARPAAERSRDDVPGGARPAPGYGDDHHRDRRRPGPSTTPRTTTSSTWRRTRAATAGSAAPACRARSAVGDRRVMTAAPAMTDYAGAYRDLRERVTDLRPRSRGDSTTSRPRRPSGVSATSSPTSPGSATTSLTGNLDGVGTDAWTERPGREAPRVAVRRMLDDWDEHAAAVEPDHGLVPAESSSARWCPTPTTHEQDIRGALDAPGARNSDVLTIAYDWGTDRFGEVLGDRGTFRFVTESGEKTVGAGDVASTVHTSRFQLVRAFTGRRSLAQMGAYHWEGRADPGGLVLSDLFQVRTTDLLE